MRSSKGHVLLIAYYYPPSFEAGAKRAEGFHRFLAEWGYRSTVITIGPATTDEAVEEGVVRIQKGGYRQGLAKLAAKRPNAFIRYAGGLYKRLTDIPDGYRGFFGPACDAAVEIARRDPFSAIVATSSPFTALHIGAALSKRLAVPWIADLRDLWTTNHFGYPFGRLRRMVDVTLERRWLNTASRIVTATHGLSTNLKNAGFVFQGSTIYNGYLNKPTLRPFEAGPFQMKFLGRLYEGFGHTPGPFFEAICAIRQNSPDLFAAMKIEFFGYANQEFWDLSRKLGLEGRVIHRGLISPDEALVEASTADLLLVFLPDKESQAVTVPTKLFDYATTRRPILFVGPQGEGADLVRTARLGRAFRSNEVAGIAAWIMELAAAKEAGRSELWGDEAQVSRFHYRWRAQDLAREIDALGSPGQPGGRSPSQGLSGGTATT
ncbi:MAG: hypothetical protein ABI672_01220 [Vicinamibacteria bacterium]